MLWGFLPAAFRKKIRHFGILASRVKPKLRMQQMKMGVSIGLTLKLAGSSLHAMPWGLIRKTLPVV